MIGGEHYFRFNHPGELADKGSSSHRSSLQDDTQRSFEFAHNEFIQAQTARSAQLIVSFSLTLPRNVYRIEAEVEEARLKEREILMEEIQTMKQQAQHEFEQEKKVYNEKLSLLENELVINVVYKELYLLRNPSYRRNMRQCQKSQLRAIKWLPLR